MTKPKRFGLIVFMTTRCLFTDCRQPVTHVVHQLWNGKTVHCCDAHIPGQKANALPEPLKNLVAERPMYRVEPIAHAS